MFEVNNPKDKSCQRCNKIFPARNSKQIHDCMSVSNSKSWLGFDGYQILLEMLNSPIDNRLDPKRLCDTCLSHAINQRCAGTMRNMDVDQQVAFATKFQRDKELIQGIDYTIENGYYVFSRWFHLKRGSCCENRCRHCPYNTWT